MRVVEDNADKLMILTDLLCLLGRPVVGVASAEAGALLFRPESFDALLTDLHLPGMSGPDLAAQPRRQAPGLQLNVSSGAREIKQRLAQEGCRYLPKPYFVAQPEQVLAACTP